MKQTVIAIIGPSGSGKTLAAEYLKTKHGIETVVSSTTRKMRDGETNGKEHWFVSKFPENIKPEDLIAYTEFGSNQYWVHRDLLPEGSVFTYVIDEAGYLMLKEKHGEEFDIFSVKVERDLNLLKQTIDQERLDRDKGRKEIDKYSYVLKNNKSLEDYFKEIDKLAQIFKNR